MSNPLQSGAILIDRDGRPTAYFLRWLNDLRTGSSVTSDDALTILSGQLTAAFAQVAALERRVENNEAPMTVQQPVDLRAVANASSKDASTRVFLLMGA